MTKRHKCPRCGFMKAYVIRREKRRCARCKYEWQPDRLPLRFKTSQWRSVAMAFFKGFSSQGIAIETGFDRKRVLRALLLMRKAMVQDIPQVFSNAVEVDETCLRGQWENRGMYHNIGGAKRGRGAAKTPVLGILCRCGKVWAEVVPDAEAKTLIPLINTRVKRGQAVFFDAMESCAGVGAKGCVRRPVEHGKGGPSDGRGAHINGLKGFWGYLKRKLSSKGGIRKERLPLYLAEYVWRYNHRRLTVEEQTERILTLLKKQEFSKRFSGSNGTIPLYKYPNKAYPVKAFL